MDTKTALIKIITMLLAESKIEEFRGNSERLIRDVMTKLQIPDHSADVDGSRGVILNLISTVEWLLSLEGVISFTLINQRLMLALSEDPLTYDAIKILETFEEMEEEDLRDLYKSLDIELSEIISRISIQDAIRKFHREAFYGNALSKVGVKQFISGFMAEMEAHMHVSTRKERDYILDMLDTDNPEGIQEIFDRATDDLVGKSGFRSGWQAMNRMFGMGEILRLGMFVLVGALTHNYKSGLVADFFRHFATANPPLECREGMEPGLVFFTAENRAEEEIMRTYMALREHKERKPVDAGNINSKEASKYICDEMGKMGWKVKIIRVDGTKINYTKLTELMLDLESEGIDVKAVCFDYLALIDKSDLGKFTMTGEDVRVLMHRTRLWFSARDILFITPHQLSQDAVSLKRQGVENFADELQGKNYWDGSKRIANEADMEIFVDIVKHNGRSWLHVVRGKHRTSRATPLEHRSFYLPFSNEGYGYILEDIDGEDTSVPNLIQTSAIGALTF